jgi:dephospho-CoA kinase
VCVCVCVCLSRAKQEQRLKQTKKREELSNNGLKKFIEMQNGTEERRAEQKRAEQKGFLI